MTIVLMYVFASIILSIHLSYMLMGCFNYNRLEEFQKTFMASKIHVWMQMLNFFSSIILSVLTFIHFWGN